MSVRAKVTAIGPQANWKIKRPGHYKTIGLTPGLRGGQSYGFVLDYGGRPTRRKKAKSSSTSAAVCPRFAPTVGTRRGKHCDCGRALFRLVVDSGVSRCLLPTSRSQR